MVKEMYKNMKLGHQAPKRWRVNKFNSVEINGDFAYCKSHNFVYNPDIEEKKLYDAQPCYYTDIRFIDTNFNFYHNTKLHWTRWKDISLKSCIRKTLKCKNIPVGTIVSFNKSWFYKNKKIDNSFKFKIRKENNLDIKFEINNPIYFNRFTNCEKSNLLVDKLRENGFIVSIKKNESFIGNMINSAAILIGKESENTEIDGEVAIAYGYGKIIGFSSYNNDFMGYSNGCDNILWDKFGNFNKWSQCHEISKDDDINMIINKLKTN